MPWVPEHPNRAAIQSLLDSLPFKGDSAGYRTYWGLLRWWRGTPEALIAAQDADLLSLRNFGVGLLREWRRLVPAPPPLLRERCPHCGGKGTVIVNRPGADLAATG